MCFTFEHEFTGNFAIYKFTSFLVSKITSNISAEIREIESHYKINFTNKGILQMPKFHQLYVGYLKWGVDQINILFQKV